MNKNALLDLVTSDKHFDLSIIINGEKFDSVISAIYEVESLYEKAETVRDAWLTVDFFICDDNESHFSMSDYMDNIISYLNSLI